MVELLAEAAWFLLLVKLMKFCHTISLQQKSQIRKAKIVSTTQMQRFSSTIYMTLFQKRLNEGSIITFSVEIYKK